MSKSTSCAQTAHWNRLSAPDPATLTRTERMRSVPGAIAPSIFRQTRFRGDRFLAKRRLAPTRASNHFGPKSKSLAVTHSWNDCEGDNTSSSNGLSGGVLGLSVLCASCQRGRAEAPDHFSGSFRATGGH